MYTISKHSSSGSSFLCSTLESYLVGAVAAFFCLMVMLTSEANPGLAPDDPVAAFAVHGAGGAWGLLAEGIFASEPSFVAEKARNGLLSGGNHMYTHGRAFCPRPRLLYPSLDNPFGDNNLLERPEKST